MVRVKKKSTRKEREGEVKKKKVDIRYVRKEKGRKEGGEGRRRMEREKSER